MSGQPYLGDEQKLDYFVKKIAGAVSNPRYQRSDAVCVNGSVNSFGTLGNDTIPYTFLATFFGSGSNIRPINYSLSGSCSSEDYNPHELVKSHLEKVRIALGGMRPDLVSKVVMRGDNSAHTIKLKEKAKMPVLLVKCKRDIPVSVESGKSLFTKLREDIEANANK